MNGLELLLRLGIPEGMIASPETWINLPAEVAFQRFLDTPLQRIVNSTGDGRIPLLDDQSGVLKGYCVMEILAYRDISKPLPLAKDLETTGEESVPQFTSTRTFKLLLTDGTDSSFVAMEYEACQALDQVRLGAKIQLSNIFYHHGVLLLTPQTVTFLGASSKIEDVEMVSANNM